MGEKSTHHDLGMCDVIVLPHKPSQKVLGVDYVEDKLEKEIYAREMTYAAPDETVIPVETRCMAVDGMTDIFVLGFTPPSSSVCSQVAFMTDKRTIGMVKVIILPYRRHCLLHHPRQTSLISGFKIW